MFLTENGFIGADWLSTLSHAVLSSLKTKTATFKNQDRPVQTTLTALSIVPASCYLSVYRGHGHGRTVCVRPGN